MVVKTYEHFRRLEIRDETVLNTDLVLCTLEVGAEVVNSTIDGCELTIVSPNRAYFFMSRFVNCTFRPKKKVQARWFDCAWENCVFHGKYVSTHFGILDSLRDSNPWGKYLVKGCDFSDAIMDYCYFSNTDVESVKFPRWPCVTLLQPERNFAKWKSTIYSIKDHLMSIWFADKGESDAFVLHWPSVAKKYQIDADPEEVKRKLQSLDGVLL